MDYAFACNGEGLAEPVDSFHMPNAGKLLLVFSLSLAAVLQGRRGA